MRHFFAVYKTLENKETAVNEVQGVEQAKQIVADAIESYKRKFGNS